MTRRRAFSSEFKREAVKLARSSGQSASQVARDLRIITSVLTRWVREAQGNGSKLFPSHGKPREEDLAALKREPVRVKKEQDSLNDAARSSQKSRSDVPHEQALPRRLTDSADACLKVSPSGYYGWRQRLPSRQEEASSRLLADIHHLHVASDGVLSPMDPCQ